MSVSDMSYASAQRLLSKESRGGRDGTEVKERREREREREREGEEGGR